MAGIGYRRKYQRLGNVSSYLYVLDKRTLQQTDGGETVLCKIHRWSSTEYLFVKPSIYQVQNTKIHITHETGLA